MKRRDDRLRHGQAADDLVHAFDHFGSSLVGECNCQDRLRHRAQVFDQMSDAIGDDAGLPATSAGQNEQRAVSGFDGFTLLRVELVEEGQTFKAPLWLTTSVALDCQFPISNFRLKTQGTSIGN